MKNFNEINLPKEIYTQLKNMGIINPTPIQSQALPHVHKGMDVLGTAETGSGKTAAFAIPLAAKLINSQEAHLLILTPTRELAGQVLSVFKELLHHNKEIKNCLLIGGDSMDKQCNQLKKKPRIIVGTPGRLNDHMRRGTLQLSHFNLLVLDETDLMLDMGFAPQIATIIEKMAGDRQTLMFSATLPPKIEKMAAQYLRSPIRICAGKHLSLNANVSQEIINTTTENKKQDFLSVLDDVDGATIVFVKTKRGADSLAININKVGYKAAALHGDLRQNKRDRVLTDFREQKHQILVATDIAARGIDIPHIKNVINYDLPQCPEDFIHRIGRTGRAGRTGVALSLISSGDRKKWQAISRLLEEVPVNKQVNKQANKIMNKPAEENLEKRSQSKRVPNKKTDAEQERPRKDTLERKPFKAFADRKASPKGASDRKTSSKAFADRNASPKGASDRKPSSKAFADRKASPKGAPDRKPSSKAFADRKASPKGAPDRKPSPKGAPDRKTSPKAFADRKPSRKGLSFKEDSNRGKEGLGRGRPQNIRSSKVKTQKRHSSRAS